MTTNGEWLFSKPFEEQVAWMNEEHKDGTLDGDTAALNAKIAELTAERDELKSRHCPHYHVDNHYCDVHETKIAELQAQVDELTAERDNLKDELIDERSELNRQINTMREVIRDFRNERDHYRSKFGKCIDYADAIHALMDEGMA